MPAKKAPHFEVHPSVVYQLGESLISDSVQALIELVKNSYDADATYAKVTIDTEGTTDVDSAHFSSEGGRIIVEDDGHGMSLEEIEAGWLTISNRKKRELKRRKDTTPGGRTPLGDKGLGRLGVQRLGEHLEIFTQAQSDTGYRFGFSWLDFETAPRLEDVDVHLDEVKFPRKHGTQVVVSGLREPQAWRGDVELKRLEQALSGMISPYKQIRNFMVIVEVDGKPLNLLEVTEQLRDIAPVRYSFTFDGEELTVSGRARLDFFRPSAPKDAELFALIVESDDGKSLLGFLKTQRHAASINLKASQDQNWFVEFACSRRLSELDKIQRVAEDGDIANPGQFSGEVDSFELDTVAFRTQSVYGRYAEYKQRIKELSGIKVYRDGFRVRVDHDWLKLGAQWTSATSYYGLKPDNTAGYVALSARSNIDLEETTDREGFKDSPYFRNFYALLQEFVAFTRTAHNFFGRSWVEFRKVRNESLAHVDARKTVEDISHAIKKGLADAPTHQQHLVAFKKRISKTVADSQRVVSQLSKADEITPELREAVTAALTDIEPMLLEGNDMLARLSEYLVELDGMKGMGQVLDDRVEGLRRQLDDVYETVALGLTAEALSHEVYNIADKLAKRAKAARTRLRKSGQPDRYLLSFIEHVQSSVMALRKQMAFLSPALRYVREQRQDIDLYQFIVELEEFYRDRLAKSSIQIELQSTSEHGSFAVRINRGKLAQVFDNLVLNSEYWLREDLSQGRISEGVIAIDIDRPFVRVSDNGSGISPSVEDVLFEPFVSAKAQGQGRGLGLFIIKQLLDSEGCSIGVIPQRNRRRRLFKFQIDLRGALK